MFQSFMAHAVVQSAVNPSEIITCPSELFDFVQQPQNFAMKASLQRVMCAADTACTLHCTGTFSRLSSPQVLTAPILLSGIGDSAVHLTHVGFDANMPLGHRNLYYGLRVGADLISLGYLSRTGRCAYIQDVDGVLRVFFYGALLFSAPR